MSLLIVRSEISLADLQTLAAESFGDMVKAVVDIERRIIAVGGELHADEEAALLDDGSRQEALWGINIYPGESRDRWIEYDSLINIRPSHGNRWRDVEDAAVRDAIRAVVAALIED